MNKLLIVFCVIFGIGCAIFVTDCATGTPRWESGIVTDKIYNHPQVHFHTHTDSKGRTTTDTTTDGPDYYIVAKVGDRAGRITVTYWTYDQFQIGQECMVQFRSGHIMEYGFTSICKSYPVETNATP